MSEHNAKIQKIGDVMVDAFHYLALFVIGATVVWSAIHEYMEIIEFRGAVCLFPKN